MSKLQTSLSGVYEAVLGVIKMELEELIKIIGIFICSLPFIMVGYDRGRKDVEKMLDKQKSGKR